MSKNNPLGYTKSIIISYRVASLIKLLVNGKLAELYYNRSNSLLVDDKFIDDLRLTSFLFEKIVESFENDLDQD